MPAAGRLVLRQDFAVRRIQGIAAQILERRAACVLCGQATRGRSICTQCLEILPWNDRYCVRCGQPCHGGRTAGIPCESCQQRPPQYHSARAPLIYEFPVDEVLKAIKFRRQLWYVPPFAALMLDMLEREFVAVDALVPVPLHRWRQMWRGFNQALEFCRQMHKQTELPILTQAVRIRATEAQAGLTAAERRRNLRGAFAVPGGLRCRHPLIVDDVITTGETCSQLAGALLKSGADSVGVLAVARARWSRHGAMAGLKV